MSDPPAALPRRGAIGFAIAHVTTAALLVVGVFMALPSRWTPVDASAALLIALHVAAGVALFVQSAHAAAIARISAFLSLGAGLLLIAIVSWTAAYLSGIYGPVGRGGAIIMTLVVALAVPYLVAIPAGELLWLGPPKRAKKPAAP